MRAKIQNIWFQNKPTDGPLGGGRGTPRGMGMVLQNLTSDHNVKFCPWPSEPTYPTLPSLPLLSPSNPGMTKRWGTLWETRYTWETGIHIFVVEIETLIIILKARFLLSHLLLTEQNKINTTEVITCSIENINSYTGACQLIYISSECQHDASVMMMALLPTVMTSINILMVRFSASAIRHAIGLLNVNAVCLQFPKICGAPCTEASPHSFATASRNLP